MSRTVQLRRVPRMVRGVPKTRQENHGNVRMPCGRTLVGLCLLVGWFGGPPDVWGSCIEMSETPDLVQQ